MTIFQGGKRARRGRVSLRDLALLVPGEALMNAILGGMSDRRHIGLWLRHVTDYQSRAKLRKRYVAVLLAPGAGMFLAVWSRHRL